MEIYSLHTQFFLRTGQLGVRHSAHKLGRRHSTQKRLDARNVTDAIIVYFYSGGNGDEGTGAVAGCFGLGNNCNDPQG